MSLKGIAGVDQKTKNLVKRLPPNSIAIINHAELDDVAACSLVAARVSAVVNAAPSLSERYPNHGPLTLLNAGVKLVENVGPEIMEFVCDGDEIEIDGDRVLLNGKVVARGHVPTIEEVKKRLEELRGNMAEVLSDFVENTLDYARQEVGLIRGEFQPPAVKTDFKGRHTLIVVRGQNYKEDLSAIKSYVDEMKPVLVGVDGGADALMEFGWRPDLIIGDMDSVSDAALRSGAELVVHAYPDGRAPGLKRLEKMDLKPVLYPSPGTSEDVAMLLAYDKGTELIVAVGTHSNVQDFLEKGRRGMASTFLVRLKVGSVLVDAKGVSKLYRNRLKMRYLVQVVLAALLPAGIVMVLSPSVREILRLLYINVSLFIQECFKIMP